MNFLEVELWSMFDSMCLFLNDELGTLVYQQGQGTFHFCQKGEGKHLICQTARIPIYAKVAWYFKIKADENGLFEY